MDCCTNQMGPGNTVPVGPGPVIQPRAGVAGMGGQFQPMTEAIDQYPIAMAYVPWQRWRQTYQLDQALSRGTIFPELDKPFMMGRCR